LASGAYCWYNNDLVTYEIPFGKLYNWFCERTGKLCPVGWHIPSDTEWKTLGASLGGDMVAGGKLKEATTAHWLSPNTDATNESGFTALPGGMRTFDGFGGNGSFCNWWSSAEYIINTAYSSVINNTTGFLGNSYFDKKSGLSVRCVKN
jgi:uncharacterized protein (TIGR02145 family)